MLCYFLLYTKVNQLYISICPLFFRFFSHVGYYRELSRIPCAIQQVLIMSLQSVEWNSLLYIGPYQFAIIYVCVCVCVYKIILIYILVRIYQSQFPNLSLPFIPRCKQPGGSQVIHDTPKSQISFCVNLSRGSESITLKRKPGKGMQKSKRGSSCKTTDIV